MPILALDALLQLPAWQALQADGVTPSPALAIAEDLVSETPSSDRRSLTLAFDTTALDHIARCTIAAADLDDFDEIRLVYRCDRSATSALFLELRLGSAALPVNAPGNDWHRRIPVASAGRWEVARFSLSDLPAAVRGAVTVLELQCIDAAQAFELRLDQALAVRPGLLADVEQALFARLHLQATLLGVPVPAEQVVAGDPWPATTPCLAIVPLEVRHLAERSVGSAQRCDFTATGYRIRQAPTAYEASYALEPVAGTRTEQAQLMDFLLRAVPARGSLRVAANDLSMETQPAPALETTSNLAPAPRQRLYCRVVAWLDGDAPSLVQPVEGLVTQINWKESGNG